MVPASELFSYSCNVWSGFDSVIVLSAVFPVSNENLELDNVKFGGSWLTFEYKRR